jgi:hypothetical protein
MGKRARSKSFGKHKPKPTEPEILEGRAIDAAVDVDLIQIGEAMTVQKDLCLEVLARSIQDWNEWLGIVRPSGQRKAGSLKRFESLGNQLMEPKPTTSNQGGYIAFA